MAGIEGVAAFSAGLNRDAEDVDAMVGKFTRRLGVGILRRVVLATPVDTGRARANWQVDLNATPQGQLEEFDKGGGAAVSKGAAKIKTAKSYGTIDMVNNVPYIGRLNEGSSRQAPAGFVEAAVDAEVAPFL